MTKSTIWLLREDVSQWKRIIARDQDRIITVKTETKNQRFQLLTAKMSTTLRFSELIQQKVSKSSNQGSKLTYQAMLYLAPLSVV